MAKREPQLIAQNKKARHEYTIEDTFEAGIVLTGTEVKSLRTGKANITDAYAYEKGGEIWMVNAHIPEYKQGNRQNHEPTRARKLLLHKREIKKLIGKLRTKGVTLIPLKLYFAPNGFAKLELGVATGKKQYEKRETIKSREWEREKARVMKRER